MAIRKDGLTLFQKKALESYLTSGFNATKAWIDATGDFSGSRQTARDKACKLFNRPEMRRAVDKEFAKLQASREETMARVTSFLRGSISDLYDSLDGTETAVEVAKKASELGVAHLIQSVEDTKHGVKVKLQDQMSAASLILKAQARSVDANLMEEALRLQSMSEEEKLEMVRAAQVMVEKTPAEAGEDSTTFLSEESEDDGEER